jgi:tRNA 5-methylaminomethyl-2-thiouridine biosynthesis bifunctional protein
MDWCERERFVVFDSDFANGACFAATVAAWRADPRRPAHLHYIALGDAVLPGFRRILQDAPGVTLDVLSGPIDTVLAQLGARIDALTLHGLEQAGTGFARALARLATPGARLTASALSAAQVDALEAAGFSCTRIDAQRIAARFIRRRPPPPVPAPRERRAIVLGAGLAGAAACERLCARGWRVTLIERHLQPAGAASGNLAGICMPLLSKDDNIMSRLSRAGFLYALSYWETLGGLGPGGAIAGAACSVLQLARSDTHGALQRAIAASRNWPPEFAQWLEPDAASARLGAAAPDGAWWFPQGGWVRPASACAAMLNACGAALERRFGVDCSHVQYHDGLWSVHDGDGLVASAPVLVLANGTGATKLAQAAALPLAPVRGQVTHLAAGALPQLPFVLCREAYLTPAIDGLHSLGASYDDDLDPQLRQASQQANLEKIAALFGLPELGRDAPLAGRVGFRCVAPDRLPLVGALPEPEGPGRTERLRDVARAPGLYALLGYASRGLTWAPLAAELLAAALEGEPLPLEADLVDALDPARFMLRERRGKHTNAPSHHKKA